MIASRCRASRHHGDRRSRLLVIERQASAFVDRVEGFDETVAISQLQDEHPADFADRVVRRIAKTQSSGEYFDVAMLFVDDADDLETCAARRLISLAIAAHAERSPRLAELVVLASTAASQALRAHLLELTDDLILGTDGKPLRVRIHFLEPKGAEGSGDTRLAATHSPDATEAREGSIQRQYPQRRLGPSQRHRSELPQGWHPRAPK
jgi:hypothetical protein